MTLILLSSPNRITLVPSLALIFNLNFLARSSEITYTNTSISINISKGVFAILIYALSSCIDLYYFRIST